MASGRFGRQKSDLFRPCRRYMPSQFPTHLILSEAGRPSHYGALSQNPSPSHVSPQQVSPAQVSPKQVSSAQVSPVSQTSPQASRRSPQVQAQVSPVRSESAGSQRTNLQSSNASQNLSSSLGFSSQVRYLSFCSCNWILFLTVG